MAPFIPICLTLWFYCFCALQPFQSEDNFELPLLGWQWLCNFWLFAMNTFMLDVMTYKPLLSQSLLEIKHSCSTFMLTGSHCTFMLDVMSFLGLKWTSSHGHRVWANWMILPSNWEWTILEGKLAAQKIVVNLMDCVCDGWGREYLHAQSLWHVFLNQMSLFVLIKTAVYIPYIS